MADFSVDGSNHPSDRLARIREEMKRLKAEEEDAKVALEALAEPERTGRFYEVKIERRSSKRIDRTLLEKKVGKGVVDGCLKESAYSVFTLEQVGVLDDE
tara:strand:+ start:530 stop:829 length:300 start_codon:yes stop_codon:yes gene_type:complete